MGKRHLGPVRLQVSTGLLSDPASGSIFLHSCTWANYSEFGMILAWDDSRS